ncbi:hypothetical protein D3C81_957400 [compost metagenome]
MSGAAGHFPGGITERLSRLLYSSAHPFIEPDRIPAPQLLLAHLAAAKGFGKSVNDLHHFLDHRFILVTRLDCEHDLVRNDRMHIGIDIDPAHRVHQLGVQTAQFAPQLRHQVGRSEESVIPHIHRRRTGMIRFPGYFNLVADHADNAVDQPDRQAFFFKDRALFDVQLQISRSFLDAVALLALIAAGFQRFAEGYAFPILALQHGFLIELARQHAGGHHGRLEPGAFFIRKIHDRDRNLRLDAVIHERPNHFKSRDNTEHTVETAAFDHRIQMGTHYNRRLILGTLKRCVHTTHIVHLDGHAQTLAAGAEVVPHLDILFAEAQPGYPVRGRASEIGKSLDGFLETGSVNENVLRLHSISSVQS